MVRPLTIASFALAVAGCAHNEAAEAPPAPPPLSVAKVIEKPITEFDEFTGRFTAGDRVELRPRVSGYISSVNFTEGHEVKKGNENMSQSVLRDIKDEIVLLTLNRPHKLMSNTQTY